MRLSMYILADWLEKYNPKISIQNGERRIRNVRPFSEEHTPTANNVYVSQLSGSSGGGIMCINENDFIFIQNAEPEEILNDIMDAFDFYNNWSDGLNRNLQDCSVQDILEQSRNVLDKLLIAADSSYYALAFTGMKDLAENDKSLAEMDRNGIIDMDLIMKIEKNPHIRENSRHAYLQDEEFYSHKPLTRNLFSGGQHMGWIIAVGDSVRRGDYDVLDELGDIIEKWLELHAEQDKFLNVNDVFIEILKGNVSDKSRLINKLKLSGWGQESGKLIYITDMGHEISGYAILHRINEAFPGTCSFIYEDRLVTILNSDSGKRSTLESEIRTFLGKVKGRCGCSPVFCDALMIPDMYDLATAACRHAGDNSLAYFGDVTLDYFCDILRPQAEKTGNHPAIKKLEDYDLENNSSMLETLRVYLLNERNIADTSRDLFIHRNSLLYRIRRIVEITGLDLDDSDCRLLLLLAFRLRKSS